LTGKFWTPEYDFAAAIQALDARANAAGMSFASTASSEPTADATPAMPTLEGILRSHTIYFALESLARELAAAQVTAREIVSDVSAPLSAK
jgi:hypothetical protein